MVSINTAVAGIGLGLAVPINDTTRRGQPVTSSQVLQRLMLTDAIGNPLPVTVLRNGALVDVLVTPIELWSPTRLALDPAPSTGAQPPPPRAEDRSYS